MHPQASAILYTITLIVCKFASSGEENTVTAALAQPADFASLAFFTIPNSHFRITCAHGPPGRRLEWQGPLHLDAPAIRAVRLPNGNRSGTMKITELCRQAG